MTFLPSLAYLANVPPGPKIWSSECAQIHKIVPIAVLEGIILAKKGNEYIKVVGIG